MPAEVEALAYAGRQVPWHGIGTSVEGLMTAAEAISAAGLDWEVVKVPSGALVPTSDADGDLDLGLDGIWVSDDGRFKTMRSSDGAFLGDVGSQYEPLQNADAFAFADSLVDSGEAKYDTAGALRGGRVVFLSMKFPKDIRIGGVDPIDLYGVLWNSHDGTKAVTEFVTPIRPVCMNTLKLGLRNAQSAWSVKHLGALDGRLAEARQSLGLTFEYADKWAEEMDQLAQQPYSDSDFEQLAERLAAGGLGEKWENGMLDSWLTGPERGTHQRSSKWDALNAVTEYGDWLREPRTATSRVESSMFGQAMRLRERANRLLVAA